jgi:hypothetical protein
MTAPTPVNLTTSIKEEISNDLKKKYKEILIKHLDDRPFKEDKVKLWMNDILMDAKEYFIKKYPNYDLFLYNYICARNVYFRPNSTSISLVDSDCCDFSEFLTDTLYSILYYFYYKKTNLSYSIEEYEAEIIQKGNEILGKFLDERKYDYDKLPNYNKNINNEHIDFILTKEKYCRCFSINEIYQKPIKNKYFFKYISHGKSICSKIFQTYVNDSLISCHTLFFFK